jgi:hypothetical protein
MTFWHSCMYEAIALAISDWGSVAIHAPCTWPSLRLPFHPFQPLFGLKRKRQ